MVTPQENEELENPFSELEIKEFVFSMEKNSAPGPHHFHVEFYQHYWEIVREDLIALVADFYHMKLDIGRINYGIM
jgi:hypothetical protein